jgi:hypothetical protein
MAVFSGGLIALVLGVIGIIGWFSEFILLLKGAVPLMLILGGALAAYLGFEEIKDKRSAGSLEDSGEDLKQEVESLKEEIKGLKEEKKDLEEKSNN